MMQIVEMLSQIFIGILSQLALRLFTEYRRDVDNECNAFLHRPRSSLNHVQILIVADSLSTHLALTLVRVGALWKLACESS
jgi:hypothetical protein